MKFEIIDFHTHPFDEARYNLNSHKEYLRLDREKNYQLLKNLGVTKICGSVLTLEPLEDGETAWERVSLLNQKALELKSFYGDFYVPGFHIHPSYVRESCEEIERMSCRGVNLIGELVPRRMGYGYDDKGLDEIFDCAAAYGAVVSFHTQDDDLLDEMVKRHPKTMFVAAHPLELPVLLRHIDRMKKNENVSLDLSGTGMFRFGMLRRLIDEVGAERILFASDYPICSPAMYVGAILLDETLSHREKELIFNGNAKRLLKL